MAKNPLRSGGDIDISRMEDMNKRVASFLRQESMPLVGDDIGRSEDLLRLHHKYNGVIRQDYQGIQSSKDTTSSTYGFIVNAILGHKPDYTGQSKDFRNRGVITGNEAQDNILKNMRLEKLFTMGDTQVATYFLSTSSDIIHIYDEIDSVCGYFYQLEEANLITRDNVLRAEQVNEDISMDIEFPGITEDVSNYVSIVKKALEYQKLSIKIRDHVVPKAIKYGTYYIMIIPYKEIGPKLLALNKQSAIGFNGYPFYESTDTHALFSDDNDSGFSTCMESVTTLFESFQPTDVKGKPTPLPKEVLETINHIKENAKNIFVSEDDSIPDVGGLGVYKNLNDGIQQAMLTAIDNSSQRLLSEDNPNFPSNFSIRLNSKSNIRSMFSGKMGDEIINDVKNAKDKDDEPEFGNIGDNQALKNLAEKSPKNKSSDDPALMPSTMLTGTDVGGTITPTDLKESEQMLGCHIKLVDPRQLIPIKIFDFVIGYYYFENYDFVKMGTSVSDIMNNQMNFIQRNMVIDGIVDSVLRNLRYGDILKGDKQLRNMVLNCILYAEKRDNPIRIKFIRPDYVIPWKTNLDEHDNGQPVMLRSLLYARLYTSLMLFYTTAIITKSTDSEFYYLRESALDGQINNQISDMMDQLEDSNIDPIQIANGNLLHGNRAINKRYFMNMGTQEIKPFDLDVVSGQQIDLHNEFLTDLKKMAIGATGVPAVMVDYVDEIEYATMLGMANIKHLTRCNSIKRDFNPALTDTAKAVIRFCYPTAIPENALEKMKISLRESRIISNNISNQQLGDSIGLCENIVKAYIGEDNNAPEISQYVIQDMTRQLVMEMTPAIPWEKLPDMYEQAIMKAKQKSLLNKIQTKAQEEAESEES